MQDAKAELIERQITFGYDFRMRCDSCGRTSTLSGADHVRLENEAHARMKCDHCPGSFHFGALVAGIRDPDDPALDDHMLNKLSWYHTSTYEDWPSPDYERDVRNDFSASPARVLLGDPERYLRGQLDKALHLGTYEAAIENMYRRMRDQANENSTFYLHRVRINVSPDRVNSGFHDENHEPAADISITELRDRGLDAVRYLNSGRPRGAFPWPFVRTSSRTSRPSRSPAPSTSRTTCPLRFLTSSKTLNAGTKSLRHPRKSGPSPTASLRNSRTPSARTSCPR